MSRSPTHPLNFKSLYCGLNWVSHVYCLDSFKVSSDAIPHYYLKAMSLEQALGAGKASRMHFH